MNYKLSIITINRNNAKGLRKTIESVFSQFYCDYEYIVIDGASTDGSIEVLNEFTDKITYWVSESDNGIYNAMNKGILKASGDYYLFLNSGDWLVENVLNDIFSLDRSEDILFGNIVCEYNNKESSVDCGVGDNEMTFYNFFETNSIRHQAAFIRNELFAKYGLYDETYTVVSDWLFFMKVIIFKQVSIKYINLNITHYDPYGISSLRSNYEIERERAFNSLLPEKVLQDYKKMKELFEENSNMKIELKKLNTRYKYLNKFFLFVKNIKNK